MRTRLLALSLALCWLLAPPCAEAQTNADDRAQIILVGPARESPELKLVIWELLQRDGIVPQLALADRFASDALLAAPDADERVHVFVTLATPQLARLYLRGPFGQRFLLRELTLRAGLDELGRESIAQVIASSAQALLQSRAGVDRAAAEAELLRERPVAPANAAAVAAPAAPIKPSTAAPRRVQLSYEIAGRAVAGWSGAALQARLGGGLELGLSQRLVSRLIVRERLVFEQLAAQHLRAPELSALVRASVLRLGLDLGFARAAHALFGALAAGVDLLHIDPERARDASWSLAKKRVDPLPMLRAELRYERRFAAVSLGVGTYADVALANNRFEVRDGARTRSVARPWRVSPGLALTLGWRSK